MTRKPSTNQTSRNDRLIHERVHDPYKARLKLRDGAVCRQCGAEYRKGRWRWPEIVPSTATDICQACQRINDSQPAGIVTLSGAFLQEHKEEILNLARNQEALEKGEHPLNRIMDIQEEADSIVIRTTDIHLPRRIGDAVKRAYDGELDNHYDEEAYFIRVDWSRSD